MKFKSFFKKSIAMTLIAGILVLPLSGLAETANSWSEPGGKYINNDYGHGAGTASKVKHNDTGSMVKTVGIGAGAGAASGALSGGIQAGVNAALSSAATSAATSAGSAALSGAASGAVGGLIMGAAGGLITATLGAAWSQIIMGTVGTLITIIWTDYYIMKAANIDAPQLALEYLIYNAMQNVTDKWDPKPAKKYQQAACSNENNGNVPTEDMDKGEEAAEYKWDFEVQVLKNVGIEAINQKEISQLANGRNDVIYNLSQLDNQLKLDVDLTHQSVMSIKEKQSQNFQWMSTAGIARAELGLETAYQASVDAGGEAATELPEVKTVDGIVPTVTSSASGSDAIMMSTQAPDEEEKVALKDLPTHEALQSTGAQMRVQSLMNLELAQRVNLANTLQGNLLSIEAARALKQSPRAIRVNSDNEGGDDDE